MGGWIKLYRDIVENPLWSAKPFSKGQAWIDILLRANHSDNQVLVGNNLEKVERGTFITSELKLMERWGWSKNKVRLFLKYLESENMIKKKSNQKRTAITVVNYRVYQDLQTTNGPLMDRQWTANGPQKNHEWTANGPPMDCQWTANGLPMVHEQEEKKEIKEEEKEGKKGSKKGSGVEGMDKIFTRLLPNYQISEPLADKIREWLTYKSERREPYKEQGMKSLLTQISKHAAQSGDGNVIELIDECMAAGYMGIVWDKIKVNAIAKSHGNKFNQFMQNDYDFDALERELLKGGGDHVHMAGRDP